MLTQADIDALIKNKFSSEHSHLLDKIVTQYTSQDDAGLSEDQRKTAENIFSLLLEHAEADVRASLATALSTTDKLPLSLATTMANDVNEVAMSILENSPIFRDDDLMTFIRIDNDIRKLEAISSRKEVSEKVSHALVETQAPSVAAILSANDGAQISYETYKKIIDLHEKNQDVISSLFQRSRLPAKAIQLVMSRISENMRKSLEAKYGNLAEQQGLQELLNKSIEQVTLKVLCLESSDAKLMQLLKLMEGSKKMTPFLALGTARIDLFEIAMARQLYVPVKNIQILLSDPNGFRRAYQAAGLPDYMFVVAEITLGMIRALEKESLATHGNLSLCTPHMLLQRIAAHERREIPGMEYITALLRKNSMGDVYLDHHRD